LSHLLLVDYHFCVISRKNHSLASE
jgi:hypothetical protein